MRLQLRNKKNIKILIGSFLLYLAIVLCFSICQQPAWSSYDYKLLDSLYKQIVEKGYGPKASIMPRIIYLTITDETYNFFGKNYLDRKDMARVNDALGSLKTGIVAYDIIFARKSNAESDREFTRSLNSLDSVYLPTAFRLSDEPNPFNWKKTKGYEQLRSNCLNAPIETGVSSPYFAQQAILTNHEFAAMATGAGAINVTVDQDNVYRHTPLLMKVDQFYYPSLSFSIFLDWANIPFEELLVEWGNRILIPAAANKNRDTDVIIPIDQRGKIFIPFVNLMGKDFELMTVHSFLNHFSDEKLKGNLQDFFQNSIVMIADVSGCSDRGATPLENNTPLITIHASMLNSLMTGNFYRYAPFSSVLIVVLLACILLVIASLLKSSWFFYGTTVSIILGLFIWTCSQFIHFQLFPLATSGTIFMAFFLMLTLILEYTKFKNRDFVKTHFLGGASKKIIQELERLAESTESKGLSFSATVIVVYVPNIDSLSIHFPPDILVKVLNEFYTAISSLIIQHEGMVDQYMGDTIIGVFGIPLSSPDHADLAVTAALEIKSSLKTLKKKWLNRGDPQIEYSVGIQSGNMIAGNIGPEKIFNYTVASNGFHRAFCLAALNKKSDSGIIISKKTSETISSSLYKIGKLDGASHKKTDEHIMEIFEVFGFQDHSSNFKID